MKKCTESDIANALGVSRVSVWKVLSGKGGTSAELKRKVISKAMEMGYLVPENLIRDANLSPASLQSMPLSIAVAVSRPETSIFWTNILHELAKQAAKSEISILYVYLPTNVPPGYQLPPQLTNADGFAVMNVYNETILRLLSDLPMPKVFMDTIPAIPFRELGGDLLLIEGRSGTEELTEHLISQGVREIGFIGDINYAQTNYERYYGYLHAMKDHGLEVQEKFCLTTPIGADDYADEIGRFLDTRAKMPRAFLCVSDFVADVLYRELTERGYRVPKDIAVAGFDGNKEYSFSSKLTTVDVNTQDIGKQLALQLFHRIRYPDFCKTITYICPTVRLSESTQI